MQPPCWNPRAYRRAGGERPPPLRENPAPISGTPSNRLLDPRYAQITHWMRSPYSSPEQVRPTGVVDSSVMPGENRVWYYYQGQTRAAQLTSSPALPARVARNLPPSTPRPPEDAGVSIEYDRLGNPTSITDPMGRQTTLRYAYSTVDGHERADLSEVLRLAFSSEPDRLASFEGYNVLHLPERIVDAAGGVTRVVYNRHGQPLLVVRPDGSEIRWTYDTLDAARTETWGNLVEVHTPSGTTSFTYNGRNLVDTATPPDGATRTFHYDGLDRLVRVDHVDETYESIGYQRLDPESGVGLVFGAGDEIERESPTGDDPRVKVIAHEWTTVRDRDGKEVRRAFDPQRRLTRVSVGGGIPTIFHYPDFGGAISDELLSMTDGNEHKTVWRQRNDTPDMARFDDRAVEMVRPDNTATRYTWDVQGRLQRAEEIRAGRFTEVIRLADGRPFQVLAADGIEILVQRFDYDPFVPRMTRARTTRQDGASPSGEVLDDIRFAYTPPGVFGAGRLMLTRHARSGVHVAHTYDELGRLKTRTTGVGHAASSALEIEYGGNGLVRSTSDVLGATLFCYNDTCDDSVASDGRRDASRLSLATLPNGALLRFIYAPPDPRQEPKLTGYETRTAPTLMSAGDLRHRVTFDLSPAGRRTAETQTWRQGGVSLPDWRRAYAYDASGRLERVSHAVVVDGRSSFFGDDHYHFDYNGNLDTETNTGVGSGGRVIGARSATFRYTLGDQLYVRTAQILWPEPDVRSVAVVVDDAGQMRYDGQAHYAWDALGRLQGVTRDRAPSRPSSFERDTFGRVTQIRDAAGVRDLVWDGLTLLEERDAETHEVIRAYAASGFTQGGASYYYLRDPLGSVVGLMDQSGNVVKTWSYDAWGFRTLSWQAEGAEEVNPALGYAGYLQHEESGLCLMPARAYSPALRRWLSRDPIGLAGGDTNLYAYAANNPVFFSDPSGLIAAGPILIALAIGAGLGLLGGGFAGGSNTGSFNWHSAWRGALIGGVGGLVAPLIAAYIPASGVTISAVIYGQQLLLPISHAALTVGTWGLGGLAGGIAGEVYDVVHGPPRGNCPIDGEFDLSGLEIGTFSGLVGGGVGSVAGLRNAASPLLPGATSAAVDSISNALQALRSAFP